MTSPTFTFGEPNKVKDSIVVCKRYIQDALPHALMSIAQYV
jgi:hypothetical protein